MLVVLCCVWGVTWPIMRIALNEVPPFTMRTFSTLVGGLALFAVCLIRRSNLRLPDAKAWTHVVVSSLLNVASFSVFSTFAQLSAATSRVAILAYTMPIWAVVLAWLCLGEKPTGTHPIAIGRGIAGLAVLIYPLTAGGIPLGIVLALATGVSWAAGTVYLKWARIAANPMAVAIWQIVIAFFVIGACMMIFEGGPDFHAPPVDGAGATLLSSLLGPGRASRLWVPIIPRLPALTPSPGGLRTPPIP